MDNNDFRQQSQTWFHAISESDLSLRYARLSAANIAILVVYCRSVAYRKVHVPRVMGQVITLYWRHQEMTHKAATDIQTYVHAVTLSALMRLPFMRGTSRSKIMSTAAEYLTPSISTLLLSAIRFCRIFGMTLLVMKVSLRLVEKSTLRSTITLPDLLRHPDTHTRSTIVNWWKIWNSVQQVFW